MRTILLLSFFLFVQLVANGQANEKGFSSPLLLDRSVLSGIGLQKIDLADEPEKDFYQKNLFRGKDISVYVVSTETWNNRMDQFPFDEFIYMYQGEALIKPDEGRGQIFHSGEFFFAPKGFTGEWEIRSGDFLHYELSVIATRREDKSAIIQGDQHLLFDKSILSGAHITLNEEGRYAHILKAGAELKVELKAEQPRVNAGFSVDQDQMIQLLSGRIIVITPDNKETKFYTGDFFILPAGCRGNWSSDGHGLIKYLVVSHS